MRVADRRGLVDTRWRQIIALASAGLAYGIATALDGSGFIAAYVGGIVFGMLVGAGARTGYLVAETGELLNALTLFVFGAVLFGSVLDDISWRVIAYAVLSLTIVRMVPVGLALLGSGARAPTAVFLGWFGPRGLASIVFAAIVVEQSELPNEATIVLAAYATVVLSVFAHGLTARPLTSHYLTWYAANPNATMERAPAAAHRWRWVHRDRDRQ